MAHRSRRTFVTFGGLVLGATLLGVPVQASADNPPAGTPKAELLVIHATHCDKKTIDPDIGRPPPSMGWECMKLLQKVYLPLVPNKTQQANLPNNRIFFLQFNGMDKDKYKLSTYLNPATGGTDQNKIADINAELNKAFNVGGISYPPGVLLLAVRVVMVP
jgi:hypothetical protein